MRTGALSRAALFIQPETLVRVDQNTNISVSQTAEETLVEFTQEDIIATSTTAHTCGAAYFITRFPRKFRVNTPHLNAAVEGTEFLVAMRCESTALSVIDGRVSAQALTGPERTTTSVNGGETLTAATGEPTALKLLVKPIDVVQWTIYYPPLTDFRVDQMIPSAEDCRKLPDSTAHACFTERAEFLLRAGQVDEARANIDEALKLEPSGGEALALRAVISVAKNDKKSALLAAQQAIDASPNSARAWLALSYAQQASFKLEDATKSVQRATELAPDSALAQSRLAELYMSSGRIRDAEKAAKRATEISPNEARAHMVLGFVYLAKNDAKRAKVAFTTAITLDSSEPLARLGFGLAEIREGKLKVGREQLEIAAALDPQNSLLRSYLGKAYYEEKDGARDRLAGVQYELAKAYDPLDPTPWFYDAIRKQTDNRAGESLSDLQRSIELNDDRAVYRSRLLLDQDSASRSVSLARIYSDVGFRQLALAEGEKSLTSDPSSYSAHRFLADSYTSIPRFDAARVSELLQSQLLQPANASALQPQLGESGLLILDHAGPPVASFQEFNPLFERDRLTAYTSGVTGNKGTFGDELLLSAQKEGNLISAGQFHYQTDGFRENDDLKQDIYTAFVQKDVSYQSSLQAEFRSSRTNRGDVTQNIDPINFSTTSRVHLDTQTGRLGARYSLDAQSTFIASVIHGNRNGNSNDQTVDNSLGIPLFIQINATGDSHVADGELQYLFRSGLFAVTAGGGYYDESFTNTIGAKVTLADGTLLTDVLGVDDSAIRHENVYLYSNINVAPHATLILGISADSLKDSNIISTEQANPKFGLVFRPSAETTLRLAAFRYLKRSLTASATLEPTQVAGFNQIFDDVTGTDSKTVGAGLDQTLSNKLFTGVQLMARKLTVPLAPAIGIDQPASDEHWRERLYRAYASWLVTPALAFNAEINYERQERDFPAGVPSEFLSSIDTSLAPLTLTYRDPGGFFAQIRSTYVAQTVEFPATTGTTTESDRFWLTYASLGYRLPRRLGVISLNATNLFDRRFRFQDTNLDGVPRAPQFWPGRLVLFAVTLAL